MTAYDPSLSTRNRGFWNWLGLRAAPATEGVGFGHTDSVARAVMDPLHQQLLIEIGLFLGRHGLAPSSYTLAIAYDYLTGTDPVLVRAIDKHARAGRIVTLDWLEGLGLGAEHEDEAASLALLMDKLESSLDVFARTATNARSATTDYNSALERHVGELEQVSKAGTVITELASIAKAMLERTREIEKEMARSQLQTQSLQRNLEDARRSAEQDFLTGLPNRRAFDARFEIECSAAAAAGEALCIAFCDIDNFKLVNDTHGHEAGDRVLKVVAQTLARISDDRCHVARHGGEEFVILFRSVSIDQAWSRLDRARLEMAERKLVNRATDVSFGQITFSGGIADVFSQPSPQDALKAADAALYRAKEEGRNRICMVPLRMTL